MQNLQGILMKSLGGFYYVRCGDKEYECKARGSFRKKGSSPVAGDRVEISVPDDGYCAIEKILERKNKLKRPALANIDALVIVCSTVDPLPNFTVIDKMTAAAVNNDMTPVLAVSKNDIKNGDGTWGCNVCYRLWYRSIAISAKHLPEAVGTLPDLPRPSCNQFIGTKFVYPYFDVYRDGFGGFHDFCTVLSDGAPHEATLFERIVLFLVRGDDRDLRNRVRVGVAFEQKRKCK